MSAHELPECLPYPRHVRVVQEALPVQRRVPGRDQQPVAFPQRHAEVLGAPHYHMSTPDDEHGVAVVDIWRVVDGQIVEHWDVRQPVPAADRTPNGMF